MTFSELELRQNQPSTVSSTVFKSYHIHLIRPQLLQLNNRQTSTLIKLFKHVVCFKGWLHVTTGRLFEIYRLLLQLSQ